MSVKGVDVSGYQAVNFPTKGLAFAFVKATEGTKYVNPKYHGQLAHARSAGLVVGHYHFAHPGNAIAQANHFLASAQIHAGDIIAYDWEASGTSQADRDKWMKHVKAKLPTHKVVLYCNLSFWKSHDTENYAGDGLWIAAPNSPAGKPAVKHSWVFHQYSWAGGIDRNVANFKDAAALRKWALSLAKPVAAPVVEKPKPKPVVTPPVTPPVVVPTLAQRVTHLELEVKVLQAKVK